MRELLTGRSPNGGTEFGYGVARLRLWGTNGVVYLLLVVMIAGFLYTQSTFGAMTRRWEQDHVDIVQELKLSRCWTTFPERQRPALRTLTQPELKLRCPWVGEKRESSE